MISYCHYRRALQLRRARARFYGIIWTVVALMLVGVHIQQQLIDTTLRQREDAIAAKLAALEAKYERQHTLAEAFRVRDQASTP